MPCNVYPNCFTLYTRLNKHILYREAIKQFPDLKHPPFLNFLVRHLLKYVQLNPPQLSNKINYHEQYMNIVQCLDSLTGQYFTPYRQYFSHIKAARCLEDKSTGSIYLHLPLHSVSHSLLTKKFSKYMYHLHFAISSSSTNYQAYSILQIVASPQIYHFVAIHILTEAVIKRKN